MSESKNHDVVMKYVNSIVDGKKIACIETREACVRFLNDLKNEKYTFDIGDADFVIDIIETTLVHTKGEKLDGTPLMKTPLLLEPWQKFIIYNLLGFFNKGTIIRRFTEAFIYIPRKNGKTTFIAALSWGLALLYRKSGSSVYITSAALTQSKQSFNFLLYNLKHMKEIKSFRILNNNQECSIEGSKLGGDIYIRALAANPDTQDSLNCNIGIADEIHAYKKPKQYNIIKEAMKAYSNKLMIGITTAGDNVNSFCYNRLTYCQKVLNGTVSDESMFIFITKADEIKDDNGLIKKGDIDYTNPIEHEKANPNYGVSIRSEDILSDAIQAQNDPQQRKDFLAKSLNIYTSSLKAYFDAKEFIYSDEKYNWTIKDLAKLKIEWYGGADLSKMHDLTAAALYGNYNGVDIVITHGWFPVIYAHNKADEDAIPLFGWLDSGQLTLTNTPTTNYSDVVKWFCDMRKLGFKIPEISFDKKFGREFVTEMKANNFRVVDQPQYFYVKSEGFRRIEKQAKDGKFYYLSSEAFLYCLQNVRAIEKTDDMIQYEKTEPNMRIDYFDAAVFACITMLNHLERKGKARSWVDE